MIDTSLPLADLHRHLDGSVRLETILDLAQQHGVPLPAWTTDELRPHVQVMGPDSAGSTLPGVMAFIAKFRWMMQVLVDYDACWRVAYENVEDAHQEGLDYVELRFSPWFMAETHSLEPAGVVEAVIGGVEEARRDLGMLVNVIGIISRTYGPDTARIELDSLLRQRDHIVALDLAGDEAKWPGELFAEHFQRAHDAGWGVTVHAGESAGPESIWRAITVLGATRIGHAVAAAQDPELMDYMADHKIGIESNLTSNVQTRTVPSYAAHPARVFLDRGMLVTLNTDDPGISAIDLRHEFEVAAPAAGLTPEHTRRAQLNAVSVAYLPPETKQTLLTAKRLAAHPQPSQ